MSSFICSGRSRTSLFTIYLLFPTTFFQIAGRRRGPLTPIPSDGDSITSESSREHPNQQQQPPEDDAALQELSSPHGSAGSSVGGHLSDFEGMALDEMEDVVHPHSSAVGGAGPGLQPPGVSSPSEEVSDIPSASVKFLFSIAKTCRPEEHMRRLGIRVSDTTPQEPPAPDHTNPPPSPVLSSASSGAQAPLKGPFLQFPDDFPKTHNVFLGLGSFDKLLLFATVLFDTSSIRRLVDVSSYTPHGRKTVWSIPSAERSLVLEEGLQVWLPEADATCVATFAPEQKRRAQRLLLENFLALHAAEEEIIKDRGGKILQNYATLFPPDWREVENTSRSVLVRNLRSLARLVGGGHLNDNAGEVGVSGDGEHRGPGPATTPTSRDDFASSVGVVAAKIREKLVGGASTLHAVSLRDNYRIWVEGWSVRGAEKSDELIDKAVRALVPDSELAAASMLAGARRGLSVLDLLEIVLPSDDTEFNTFRLGSFADLARFKAVRGDLG